MQSEVTRHTKCETNFDFLSSDSLASTLDKECIKLLQKDPNGFLKTDTSLNLNKDLKEKEIKVLAPSKEISANA
eukprot:CAMPEP_0170550300 /NCGR_PEP_ID=MMETSP0211-20121228/8367_1 /TAXON_ID=311385 /ORGANISM="Pseudokeronopsis sp., Strain OXSARD2" /LENGTH=73 /DNA_ID=CAMNT_0010856775 /DNA_START=643 /DNA_END=864 /DNA_ORIENTATION=+